jgi:hypothetical protein
MSTRAVWSTSESDLGVIAGLPGVQRLFVLPDQHPPALHRDLEVPDATLRAIKAVLRPSELVLGVVQVRPQQVELRALPLVELRGFLGLRPIFANHVHPFTRSFEVAFAPTRRCRG